MIAVRTPQLRAWTPAVAVGPLAKPLAQLAMLAAIGVELAVLAAYLPDTLDHGWNGPTSDFHNLYVRARGLELMGLYSPALTLLLYPLARLPEMPAFRVFFALNAAALLGVACLAQRPFSAPAARVAVALAVISLPQAHWALRLGHLTPMLALAALGGLVLAQRHPGRAAAVLAFLSIKPQYAAAPFLLLLWRKQGRPALMMLGLSAVMAIAGFAVIGLSSVGTFFSLATDWGATSSDNLLPVQQSWLYSWPGVQISLGMEPNPLLTADLILLSLGATVVAWVRGTPAAGAAAAALAMIPLAPYAQFYDGALLVAGLALIVRAGLRPALQWGLFAGLYLAALATQANTIFPAPDLLADAHTDGIFWLTPAMAGAIALIALAGRSRGASFVEDADGG